MAVDEQPGLLLLHGILSSRAVWTRLRRELTGSVSCSAPDLPGFGASAWPGEAYTLDTLVDALEPLIEREEPTHVVGHSMGAIVALALARRYPGRFERLGVIGLPLYEDRRSALEFLGQRGPVVRALLKSDRAAHLACIGASATFPYWRALARRRLPTFSPAMLRNAVRHSGQAHRAFESIVFAGLVEQLAGEAGVPVAALHGDLDRAAPLAEVVRVAEAWGWDLTVAPGTNHQVVFERPRLTADWIRRSVLAADAPVEADWQAAGA